MKNALSFWPVDSKKIVHPNLCQQFVACKLISHAALNCYIVIQTIIFAVCALHVSIPLKSNTSLLTLHML